MQICEKCMELENKKGKVVLVRSPWHLIQIKLDRDAKLVHHCFQSREGEVELLIKFCPYCGRPYYGSGGFFDD